MIGYFDFGLGGLSVLRAVRARAPKADAIYFGDTKHTEHIADPRALRASSIDDGLHVLRTFGAQQIIAASEVASRYIRPDSGYGAKVIEMTKPTAHALREYRGARVLLLATPPTVASEMYAQALHGLVDVDQLPISSLAGAIETGESEAAMRAHIRRAFFERRGEKYDIVVLGCTHFPLIRSIFEEELAAMFGRVHIVDPAEAVAAVAAREFDLYGSGQSYFYLSDESQTFRRRVDALFPHYSSMRVV
jgi:glutamate racemase